MALYFGIQVKRMRTGKQITQAKLTQAKFAQQSYLDRTYNSMLEGGLRIPNHETVMRMARALNVTAAEIVRGIESNKSFHHA